MELKIGKVSSIAMHNNTNIIEDTRVKCEICGKLVHCIGPRHIKTHNITTQKYKELYPDAKTIGASLSSKLSSNNAFKREDIKDKCRKTKMLRHGSPTYNNSKGWNNAEYTRARNSNPEFIKKISAGIKRSYINNPELRKLRSETFGVAGTKNFIKRRDEMIKSGEWTDAWERPEFYGYKSRVYILTERNFKKYCDRIPNSEKRSRTWHLDHRYSIYEAYRNNVDESIVAHPANLEIISASANSKKVGRCSISLEQLKLDIVNYELL